MTTSAVTDGLMKTSAENNGAVDNEGGHRHLKKTIVTYFTPSSLSAPDEEPCNQRNELSHVSTYPTGTSPSLTIAL